MKFDLSSFSFVELGMTSTLKISVESEIGYSLSTIVTTAHREEEDVHVQALRESEGDRDGSTLTRKVRSPLVHSLPQSIKQKQER